MIDYHCSMEGPGTDHWSGQIWRTTPARRASTVLSVCKMLQKTYGSPRFGNPLDPLDDLIYIIVSTRTSLRVAGRTFREIKATYRTWDDLLKSPGQRFRKLLKPAGLSGKKSLQIRGALRMIAARFGRCELRFRSDDSSDIVEQFLVSLPGVSEKVAKCVMLYTMRRRVLPVDVHVHRVATRLGWVDRKRADQCHDELESLIPPALRHRFHVGFLAHGQAICRAKPKCGGCPLQKLCDFYKKNHGDA
jgi:endonuclease III